MLKLGLTYKKSQTNWKLLIEATSSLAESNIYEANDVRPNIRLRLQLRYRHRQRNRGRVNLLYGNSRDYKLNIYNFEENK